MRPTIPALALALALVAPSAHAQRFIDITANAVWLDPTGGGSFDDLEDPAEIEFDSDLGYGAAVNVFLGDRLSLEVAAARIEPETTVTRRRAVGGPVTVGGGNLEIMPLTATLQFHFAPNGFIDPYIGAGGAYVLYDLTDSPETDDIQQIDSDDDIGFAVNAGVGFRLGSNFAINVDAKYIPIESNATAVVIGENEEAAGRFEVSPIIVSAGLSLRF